MKNRRSRAISCPELALLAWLSLAVACGQETKTTPAGGQDAGPAKDSAQGCIPSEAVYNDTAKKMLDDHCGACHGKTVDYGAPYTFGTYKDLIAMDDKGVRKVDRIAERMATKSMPPIGFAKPPHNVQDTLTEWASCGNKHPDHSKGLEASAPILIAPEKPPVGMASFDLKVPDFPVASNLLDHYHCFNFPVPVSEDRFLRRIDALIDQSKVLHHIVVVIDRSGAKLPAAFECSQFPQSSRYIWAWAPGTKALQFPEGGLRLQKGDQIIIQIHYNNGAGLKNIVDHTGVRIWHDEPTGKEWGQLSPGPVQFIIPSGGKKTVSQKCTSGHDYEVLSSWPHMHELGDSFVGEIEHKDGSITPLIELDGWNFEMQLTYHTPATLKVGDKLVTRCTWDNQTGKMVPFGLGTKDEMCFNFIYLSPPPDMLFCSNGF